MTERVDPAVRGRDKGWRNDEPTALRKGGDDMDGVRRVVTDANIDDNNFMNDKYKRHSLIKSCLKKFFGYLITCLLFLSK